MSYYGWFAYSIYAWRTYGLQNIRDIDKKLDISKNDFFNSELLK